MTPMLTPWADLLSKRFNNVGEEYGPNSQEVASALWVLNRTNWMEHAGEPLRGDDIVVVSSWDAALKILNRDLLTRDRRYNATGQLEAPCACMDDIFERIPEREIWWQKARDDAKPYTAIGSGIPDFLRQKQQDLIYEHLYEYVSMLLAEIIASPEARCTYFREQLSWFQAGHFPCGWEGDWPSGRMRVF